MTVETGDEPDGALSEDLHAARAAAWEEHRRRCADNEPYADGVTPAALAKRIEGFAAGTVQIRRSGQGYAPAVSSHEDSLSADVGLDGEDDDVEPELAWVDVLPERDRRLFAEEMSQLLAEAAKTDDFAEVQQTLREWRVTSEIYLDPELLKRLTEPLTANGDRVPRPVV